MKGGKIDKKASFRAADLGGVSSQVSGGDGEAHANGPILHLSSELPKKFKKMQKCPNSCSAAMEENILKNLLESC